MLVTLGTKRDKEVELIPKQCVLTTISPVCDKAV